VIHRPFLFPFVFELLDPKEIPRLMNFPCIKKSEFVLEFFFNLCLNEINGSYV
jgi:hypothetical protein